MENQCYKMLTITSVERTGYYFNRKCAEHLVLKIRGEGSSGEIYECALPILVNEGHEWEFFADGKKVVRAVTEDDQREMLNQVNSYFPDFGKLELTGDSVKSFLAWIGSGDVTVNAKIVEPYTDKEGVVHHQFKCCKPGLSFDDSWLDALGKSEAKLAKAVDVPPPAKPKAKSSVVRPSSLRLTKDDAWKAYKANMKDDPAGVKFWERVGTAAGKDATDYLDFTNEDWQKVIEKFEMPF